MSEFCFKSSVKSLKAISDASNDVNKFSLEIEFNPNEFIQNQGVILAFENNHFTLPVTNNNVDVSKIKIYTINQKFKVHGKGKIDVFIPFLNLDCDLIVYFDSNFEISKIEKVQ